MKHSILARITISILIIVGVASCTESTPIFHADGSPARLSQWNQLALRGSVLAPNESTEVYLPANQLFTDYAHKLRTLWMPT